MGWECGRKGWEVERNAEGAEKESCEFDEDGEFDLEERA